MEFTVTMVVNCLQGSNNDIEDIKKDIQKTLEEVSEYVDKVLCIDVKVCQ